MRLHDKNGYDAGPRFNDFMEDSCRNNGNLPSIIAIEHKFMIVEDK